MKAKNRKYLEPLAERLWKGFMSDDTFNDSTEYYIQKIYNLESQLKEVEKLTDKYALHKDGIYLTNFNVRMATFSENTKSCQDDFKKLFKTNKK